MCATFINRNQRKIYIIVKPKSIDFENYRSFHSVKCVQALNHQLAAICLTELQTSTLPQMAKQTELHHSADNRLTK